MAVVHASPVADFAADVCEGIESSFTDLSLPGGNAPLQSWLCILQRDATSDVQHPGHQFDSLGTYTVPLLVEDGLVLA